MTTTMTMIIIRTKILIKKIIIIIIIKNLLTTIIFLIMALKQRSHQTIVHLKRWLSIVLLKILNNHKLGSGVISFVSLQAVISIVTVNVRKGDEEMTIMARLCPC
jgi:hypothetical protein